LWATVQAHSKFNGTGMVLTNEGFTRIKLQTTNEIFSFDRPRSLINNIIIGTLYVDLDGNTTI